jgi:DNA-binding Lrp family transcriptional regulator
MFGVIMKENWNFKFDKTDWKIAQELRKDARASSSEIARKLDLNPRTVRNRIDRMVDSGGIRPYWVFEPKAFGYVISVDIFLKIEADKADDIYENLISLPQVSYLAYGNGKESLSIEALFKTLEEMDEFIHFKLPAYPGITVESHALVPKVLRNLYEWEPDISDYPGDSTQ